MSLAHLRETKSPRNRTPPMVPRKVTTSPAAFCGASLEPAYRTMDEATASGLELCDTCVALFRRQRKAD
jgi:hypothetical protein